MSQENLEIVRRWAAAIGRGDLAERLWDPDLVIVNAEGWALEATYRGYEGLRQWWHDLDEAFSDFAMQVEEITPIDGERFLTEQRFMGHFRQTGIQWDAPWASVVTVEGRRIKSAVGYLSKRRALKALGLSEQTFAPDSS
jgi:ketosteroid isomerase-like protein